MADLAAMVPDILAKTELGSLQWEEPDFNELEAILPPYKLQLKPSREGLTLNSVRRISASRLCNEAGWCQPDRAL